MEEEISLVATAATESGHETEAALSTRPVLKISLHTNKIKRWNDRSRASMI